MIEAGERAQAKEESEGKKPAPGVILGPDGKPCRACNSKLAFSAAMKGALPAKAAPKAEAAKTSTPKQPLPCPPDGTELGNATWTFLHSAAAYFPDRPSAIQQELMLGLLRSLAHVYPCAPCAEALREEYAREVKPRNEGGGGWEEPALTMESAVKGGGPAVRRWLCGVHNEVNERLGKPKFNCDEKALDERWKNGPADGRCD